MNVNKVILVGRLTRDPEIRTTGSGQSVATVGLATSSTWNDKSGQKQEKTEFHTLVLWGRLAEIAGQYLIKGQESYFEGRLQTRSYTGKDGVERRTTEVVVENMQMGQKPRGGGEYQGGEKQRARPTTPATVAPAVAKKPAVAQEEEIPTINIEDDKEEIKIEDVPF